MMYIYFLIITIWNEIIVILHMHVHVPTDALLSRLIINASIFLKYMYKCTCSIIKIIYYHLTSRLRLKN